MERRRSGGRLLAHEEVLVAACLQWGTSSAVCGSAGTQTFTCRHHGQAGSHHSRLPQRGRIHAAVLGHEVSAPELLGGNAGDPLAHTAVGQSQIRVPDNRLTSPYATPRDHTVPTLHSLTITETVII